MHDLTFTKEHITNTSEVKELGIAAYSVYADGFEPLHRETWLNNLSSDKTYQTLLDISTVYTCRHQGKLVGMAYLIRSGHPTDIYEADWSYIRFLGVYPQYSGKGIARRLTTLCIEQARAAGEKTIALHTSEFMDAARHIYESLGFRQLRDLPLRFGKKYWLYTLSLDN